MLTNNVSSHHRFTTRNIILIFLGLCPATSPRTLSFRRPNVIDQRTRQHQIGQAFVDNTRSSFFGRFSRRQHFVHEHQQLHQTLRRLRIRNFRFNRRFTNNGQVRHQATRTVTRHFGRAQSRQRRPRININLIITLRTPSRLHRNLRVNLPFSKLITVLRTHRRRRFTPNVLSGHRRYLQRRLTRRHFVRYLLSALTHRFNFHPTFFDITNTLLRRLTTPALVTNRHRRIHRRLKRGHQIVSGIIRRPLRRLLSTRMGDITLVIVTLTPTRNYNNSFVRRTPHQITTTTRGTFISSHSLRRQGLRATSRHFRQIQRITIVRGTFGRRHSRISRIFVNGPGRPQLTTFSTSSNRRLFRLVTRVRIILHHQIKRMLLRIQRRARRITHEGQLQQRTNFRNQHRYTTRIGRWFLRHNRRFLRTFISIHITEPNTNINQFDLHANSHTVDDTPHQHQFRFKRRTHNCRRLVNFNMRLVNATRRMTLRRFRSSRLSLSLRTRVTPNLRGMFTRRHQTRQVILFRRLFTRRRTRPHNRLVRDGAITVRRFTSRHFRNSTTLGIIIKRQHIKVGHRHIHRQRS